VKKFFFFFILLLLSFSSAQKAYAGFRVTPPTGPLAKGQSFSIQYSGAVRNGCYGFFYTPSVPSGSPSSLISTCTVPTGAYAGYKLKSGSRSLYMGGIPNAGTYTLRISGYNSVGNDSATITLIVTENTTGPKIQDASICVYKQGEPAPPFLPNGGCTNTGAFEDTFIFSGKVLNITNPSETPINILYADDCKTYSALATVTSDEAGLFSKDISTEVRSIRATTSTTGTVCAYAVFNIGSTEYKSGTANFNITNLRTATPLPSSSPTPPLPPCKKFINIQDGQEVTVDQIKKDKAIKYKCVEFDTGLGIIGTDPMEFVKKVFSILLSLSGGVAMLIIIFSGYRYMTAAGDQAKLQGARETLTSAIVGLLFIVFSLVILEVVGVDILHLPGLGR